MCSKNETAMRQDPEERLLLIDCDAGADDAWAIIMALVAHKSSAATGIKVIGVTTTCGNARVENVSVNVTRTLKTLGENLIPIFQGMGEFLMSTFHFIEEPPYHGEDGFGDANLPPLEPRLENDHAVTAIIKLAEQYQGRLSVVALGPLTNLAVAVKMKPEIKDFIKEIFILGGNMNGQGNVTASAEFNFSLDPEAVAICVDSYLPGQITILPWETCLEATSTRAFRMETLGVIDSPQMELLNAIEAHHLGANKDTWMPPDAVLMSCVINPRIILSSGNYYAKAEVNGTHTRGMLVVDKGKVTGKPPNVKLITKLNVPAYENHLIWAAGGPPPQPFVKQTLPPKRTRYETN